MCTRETLRNLPDTHPGGAAQAQDSETVDMLLNGYLILFMNDMPRTYLVQLYL